MPCKRPVYKTRKDAKRHGHITYGKDKFSIRKVKYGYTVKRK